MLAKTSSAKEADDIKKELFRQLDGASFILVDAEQGRERCGTASSAPRGEEGLGAVMPQECCWKGCVCLQEHELLQMPGCCLLSCARSPWVGQRRLRSLLLLPSASDAGHGVRFGVQSCAAARTCPQDPSLSTCPQSPSAACPAEAFPHATLPAPRGPSTRCPSLGVRHLLSSTLWIQGQKASCPVLKDSKITEQSLPDVVPAAPASVHARLRCALSNAGPFLAPGSGRGRACLRLFMLPAAPNPCHRVSMWENMFWDHATCISALLRESSGSERMALPLGWQRASPTVGHGQFWDSDSKAGISRKRWLCCHSGLLSRGWQCSWMRPPVCGMDLGCQGEGLAA